MQTPQHQPNPEQRDRPAAQGAGQGGAEPPLAELFSVWYWAARAQALRRAGSARSPAPFTFKARQTGGAEQPGPAH